MRIQKTASNPVRQAFLSSPGQIGTESDEIIRAATDTFDVGRVVSGGISVAAGIASSLVLAPRALIKPTVAALAKYDYGRESLGNLLYFGTLTAIGTLGGAMVGGASLAIAGMMGGVAVSMGRSLGAQASFEEIDKARGAARERAKLKGGNEMIQRGAAFTAGYWQVAKENYRAGESFVDSVRQGIVAGARNTADFFAGVVGQC